MPHPYHPTYGDINRGGTHFFFCALGTVCLALTFFRPAVTQFFSWKTQSSRQIKNLSSVADQRPCCHFCHDANPLRCCSREKNGAYQTIILKSGHAVACGHLFRVRLHGPIFDLFFSGGVPFHNECHVSRREREPPFNWVL